MNSGVVGWTARLGLLALTLWLGLGGPSRSLLEALLPAQAWMYQRVMPDHQVLNFGLRQQSAQLSLAVRSQTVRYIVVRGKAYPPGVDFEASTPARAALLVAMLVVSGGVLVIRGESARWAWRATVCLAAAVALAIAVPTLILAGAQWGLAYAALEDLSLPALMVGASDFLLHGGGLALSAAVVWGLRTKGPGGSA